MSEELLAIRKKIL